MNQTILLRQRPVGLPKLTDFEIQKEKQPLEIKEGEILLETKYISVDPYLRGRMNDAKSYVPPFNLHEPISSGIVAEVVASKNERFSVGEFVFGALAWKTQQVSKGVGLTKINSDIAPLSAYLGVLGMTGLTAYLGLKEIGKPMAGETLLVSGAAGAVGSIVGQIGKILGLHVVGIAGTDDKVNTLKNEFRFDEVINYNTTKDMAQAIMKACPNGVDIYFDNVGGSISDSVLFSINRFARIIICGAISLYNSTKVTTGISPQPFLVKNSALMQGFIVSNYTEKFPEAMKQLTEWLTSGQLGFTETVVKGFENTPQAFIDLFSGKNKGKMIVKI